MEYHNNILCITLDEWLAAGLSYFDYENDKKANYLQVLRKGGNGRKALISYDSIVKSERKCALELAYGKPNEYHNNKTLRDHIITDDEAARFFAAFELEDNRRLPDATIKQYITNASILNALIKMHDDSNRVRKTAGGGNVKNFYKIATEALEAIKVEYNHALPSNARHLQRLMLNYREIGYPALISGRFCNENRRKVTADVERIVMSLYAMPNKPFAFNVWEMYKQFIEGKIDVVDKTTGEVFDRKKFVDKKGNPIDISEATVWNILNNPKNRSVVDKMRSGTFQYNNEHRPHHHRHSPFCSFSKISMDDRDLPRKLLDGKKVKAYYAYDVASGCIIGYAHSRTKDEALFIDCLRDTFRMIERNGFGMPAEVEVENHLVNKFFDDLALMFPYLRICNPGNSQEKRAEHFNKAKKYQVEKQMYREAGRWWARCEAYRIDVDKVNDEFKVKGYTYEQLVADDIESIRRYNNALHRRQKYYPGMTRWDVLKSEMNPNLKPFSKALVYKTIGEHTETTVRRNQYVTVQYTKYALPDPAIINRLLPNNYTVDAYYLPDESGVISEVFVYQKGQYICKCDKIIEYNESKAEQTDADRNAMTDQAKYVAKFDKMTKAGKEELARAAIIPVEETTIIIESADPVIITNDIPREESIDDMLENYDPLEYANRAATNL